jgi:hypothetical protein
MQLAANSFTLKLGDKSLDLKPSLRAAVFLNQKYAGFQNLSRYIAEGSLTTSTDLITWTVDDKQAWADYALTDTRSMMPDVMAARDQLLDFVPVLTGSNTKSDQPQTGKPISFDEYFTRLFKIGTGWLGWSPDVTWNATPSEILAAFEGRQEMLTALFGSKSEEQSADEQSADMADVTLDSMRDDLNAIGDMTNHVMP